MRMSRFRHWVLFALWLGCGRPPSLGTAALTGDGAFEVKSAVAVFVPGTSSVSAVYLTDVENYCDEAARLGRVVFDARAVLASVVSEGKDVTAGEYASTRGRLVPLSDGTSRQVELSLQTKSERISATTGLVRFDVINEPRDAGTFTTGSFEASFALNGSTSGTFDARVCPGLNFWPLGGL